MYVLDKNVFFMLLTCALAAYGLRCWTCENASSNRECRARGRSVTCQRGQQMSCQTEVRHHGGWGNDARITKRCKATLACANNQKQNSRRAWNPTQCSPNLENSVCRCCCSTNHCNKNNPWCIRAVAKCATLGAPAHGSKVCKYARSETEVGSSCTFKCNKGYVMRGSSVSVCSPKPDLSGAKFDEDPPKCVIKETVTDVSSSARDSKPGPLPTICDHTPPKAANVHQACIAGENDVVCTYFCDANEEISGTDVLTCSKLSGSQGWSGDAPECVGIPACRDFPEHPPNGEVTCDGDGSLGTVCQFICSAGYDLVGSRTTTCVLDVDVAVWEPSNPSCMRPFCSELQAPLHGEMSCTSDSNIGSVCTFRCTEVGYELQPSNLNQVTCTEQAVWSHKRPCCNNQCPPIAPMDVVIVLDSSSSVGKSGWQAMQAFIKKIVGSFYISTNSAHFALLRFNRFVDEESQIFLDDFPNDKEGLLNAIDSMPYNGKGTYIGNALLHTKDVLLKRGNRDGVKDMVWVMTDGISADDVDAVAREIREDGAEVYALGITRPDRSDRVDEEQLLSIAGDSDHVLMATEGMTSLSTELVQSVAQSICENTCN